MSASGLNKFLVPLAAMVIFLILWELLVWVNGWPNYKMASPSDIWPAFWKFRDLFIQFGWDTLWRTVVGLVLAVFVGALIGMVMGFSKTVRDGLYPLLVGFNAIPKATVVPVIALLFVGAHDMNTILIAFMISFSPSPCRSQSACRPWSRNTEISFVHSVRAGSRYFGRLPCRKPCQSSLAR